MKSTESRTLNNWANEDKPREKMLRLGKKNLSNAELLAILLGNGIVGTNVVDIAQKVLQSTDNDLIELSKRSVSDLKKIDGIGEAKSLLISAALELGYRMINNNNDSKILRIDDSRALYDYIGPRLMDLPTEEFWAIYLNNANRILGCEKISSGGLSATAVDVRCIFKPAIEKNATAIAVAHNHPSGKLIPSQEDIRLTKNIVDAGKILKIPLIDHIIVGVTSNIRNNYYSFRDNGII